jgi:hypothetical protein
MLVHALIYDDNDNDDVEKEHPLAFHAFFLSNIIGTECYLSAKTRPTC